MAHVHEPVGKDPALWMPLHPRSFQQILSRSSKKTGLRIPPLLPALATFFRCRADRPTAHPSEQFRPVSYISKALSGILRFRPVHSPLRLFLPHLQMSPSLPFLCHTALQRFFPSP